MTKEFIIKQSWSNKKRFLTQSELKELAVKIKRQEKRSSNNKFNSYIKKGKYSEP